FFSRNDGMLKGLKCHEITFYFLMKSRGTQELNSHSITQGFEEKMCWLPIDKLSEYDAYPKFFAEKLKNLKPHPEHIVTIRK
ncbi:MAG: NUDIX hydrolase, partial [Alphaproteobacteria bacterium]|nr:NUDIX hydrolase [Alphaproteobacteria bacterium]